MGTNYYIHKRNRLPLEDLVHIGKSVFKKPNGEFIWAITPDEFIKKFKENTGLIVVDENGKRYTYLQFWVRVDKRNWNLEHVGTEFT